MMRSNAVSYSGVASTQGSVFATNGGSLTLVDSTLGKNAQTAIQIVFSPRRDGDDKEL